MVAWSHGRMVRWSADGGDQTTKRPNDQTTKRRRSRHPLHFPHRASGQEPRAPDRGLRAAPAGAGGEAPARAGGGGLEGRGDGPRGGRRVAARGPDPVHGLRRGRGDALARGGLLRVPEPVRGLRALARGGDGARRAVRLLGERLARRDRRRRGADVRPARRGCDRRGARGAAHGGPRRARGAHRARPPPRRALLLAGPRARDCKTPGGLRRGPEGRRPALPHPLREDHRARGGRDDPRDGARGTRPARGRRPRRRSSSRRTWTSS